LFRSYSAIAENDIRKRHLRHRRRGGTGLGLSEDGGTLRLDFEKAIETPVILHFSDLHFGNANRYKGDKSYGTLLRRTKDDLDSLRREFRVQPNIALITGDITDHGIEGAYTYARSFIEGLINHAKIPKERVVIVPGNHDVNWHLCKAARESAEKMGREFKPPYFAKFRFFKSFFDEFYRDIKLEFTSKLYQVYNLSSYGLLVIALNSCFKESEVEHYGYIDRDGACNAFTECDRIASASGLLRVVVMHHNFLGLSDVECENLVNAGRMLSVFKKYGVRLIIHGHQHSDDLLVVRDPRTDFEPLCLSTGSMGTDPILPEGIPCKYQIIKIDPIEGITLFMRQYYPWVISAGDEGRWVPDVSREGAENGVLHVKYSGYRVGPFDLSFNVNGMNSDDLQKYLRREIPDQRPESDEREYECLVSDLRDAGYTSIRRLHQFLNELLLKSHVKFLEEERSKGVMSVIGFVRCCLDIGDKDWRKRIGRNNLKPEGYDELLLKWRKRWEELKR